MDETTRIELSERRGVELGHRLVALWANAGHRIRPGIDPPEIEAFEQRYDVSLPADLRGYFLAVDGMDDDLDPGFNRFWPLEMVKPSREALKDMPDRDAYPGCFIFADHCIWSLAWGVQLASQPAHVSGPVFQINGSDVPGPQVASSFAAFIEAYLVDQLSVLR